MKWRIQRRMIYLDQPYKANNLCTYITLFKKLKNCAKSNKGKDSCSLVYLKKQTKFCLATVTCIVKCMRQFYHAILLFYKHFSNVHTIWACRKIKT